jgi:hypothetical protein
LLSLWLPGLWFCGNTSSGDPSGYRLTVAVKRRPPDLELERLAGAPVRQALARGHSDTGASSLRDGRRLVRLARFIESASVEEVLVRAAAASPGPTFSGGWGVPTGVHGPRRRKTQTSQRGWGEGRSANAFTL